MINMDEALKKLREATEWANRNFPLPRCKHGKALKDHAGEILEPTCGCRFQAATANMGEALRERALEWLGKLTPDNLIHFPTAGSTPIEPYSTVDLLAAYHASIQAEGPRCPKCGGRDVQIEWNNAGISWAKCLGSPNGEYCDANLASGQFFPAGLSIQAEARQEIAPRKDAGGYHHPRDCGNRGAFLATCSYCDYSVQPRADHWHAHYDAAMAQWKQAEQQLAEARAQGMREAAEIARHQWERAVEHGNVMPITLEIERAAEAQKLAYAEKADATANHFFGDEVPTDIRQGQDASASTPSTATGATPPDVPDGVASEESWQPIESAPKDGTHILAADFSGIGCGLGGNPQQAYQCVVHWWEWCDGTHQEEWGWYPSTGAGESNALTNLTHWRPLQEKKP